MVRPRMAAGFDRIARPYRWLEYLSFGPMLERCRFHRVRRLRHARRALVLGDGDGRFLAKLLRQNPDLHADVVDQSAEMLRLLGQRVRRAHADERITLHQADARSFAPTGSYDLVVTHFFLDCFTTGELHALVSQIRPHLAPGARWIVSEFAIPAGPASIPAKLVVTGLYAAFGQLTGLGVRQLPDYAAALRSAGLALADRKTWLAGLLASESWELQATARDS